MLIYWHHCYLCSSSCVTDSLIWLVLYKPCCVLLTGDHASNITTGKYHNLCLQIHTFVHFKALVVRVNQHTNKQTKREKTYIFIIVPANKINSIILNIHFAICFNLLLPNTKTRSHRFSI